MVTLSQFDTTVQEIKRSFYHLIKHPYLDLYLADPEVDEDKIRFLYAMLQNVLPNKDVELYTISTLLVQAALDVHEEINLHNITETFERRKGQLEILAGDYYSSLYYYLLAKNSQLPMIQVFSHTIQEINEFKMNIYLSPDLTFDEAKKNIILIESILLQKIAAHFDLDGWDGVLENYFFLKRILHEKSEWKSGRIHPLTKALGKDVSEENITGQLEKMAGDVKDQLIEKSSLVKGFEEFIIELVDQLFKQAASREKVVEER